MTRRKYPSDTKPRARKRGAGQITLSLGDTKALLDSLSAATGRTPSELVREAIARCWQNHKAI